MTTESKPFLGRCKHEGCDYAVFATDEDLSPANELRDVQPGGAYRVGGRGVLGRCPQNHRVFPLKRIEGTYSEDFKCDSRCLNAKGHTCKCSCGGINHGRGHAVQVQPVATTVANKRYAVPGEDANERIGRVVAEQQAEEVRYPKQHIGVEGEKIYFEAKLDRYKEINDSVLYVFLTEVRTPITGELLGEAKIEWWMPDFVDDPNFKIGEVYKLKAKVKAHKDDPHWGKSTVVTYLEEV
jgi:hypothetical protein